MRREAQMIIFQVSNDESIQTSARLLSELNWSGGHSKSEVRTFFSDSSMKDTSIDSLRQMVFIGHAGSANFGDYSADQFADKFSGDFIKAGHSETDKLHVEHIFVIGCDLGLAKSNEKSLAQEIANAMAKKGFSNLQVHTVINPANIPPKFAIFFEVVKHTGLSTLHEVEAGQIKAYILNSVQSKKVEELEHKLEKEQHSHHKVSLREQIKGLQKKGICVIYSADLVEELQKPQNIFIPDESMEDRKARIAHPQEINAENDNIASNQSQANTKKHAIELLQKRYQHEVHKLSKANKLEAIWLEEVTENLELLIDALEIAANKDWQATIQMNLHVFALFGREKSSTTYRLLVALAHGQEIKDPLDRKEISAASKKAEHVIETEKKSIDEARKLEERRIEAHKAREEAEKASKAAADAEQASKAAAEAEKASHALKEAKAKKIADHNARKAKREAEKAEKNAHQKEQEVEKTENHQRKPSSVGNVQQNDIVKAENVEHKPLVATGQTVDHVIPSNHEQKSPVAISLKSDNVQASSVSNKQLVPGLFIPATGAGSKPAPIRTESVEQVSKDSIQFNTFKQRILDLKTQLSAEIKDKNRSCGCFSFFYGYEIETKTQKSNALTTLSIVDNLEELQRTSHLLMMNERVMRSKKTSRVSDLLRDITSYQPLNRIKAMNRNG